MHCPLSSLSVMTVGSWPWSRRGKPRVYDHRLYKVPFKMGDLVVIPSVGNWDFAPHHWLFAVSSTELYGVTVTKRTFFNHRATIISLGTNERNKIWRIKALVVPRVPGRPDMSRKGRIVARRLEDKKVYFHLLRCNCGHYVDYFAYGKVYGVKGKKVHLPINKNCPLYNVIDENTDVTSSNFKLIDGHGNKYDLNPYTPDMEDVE